jgi:hypothetical protein
MKNATASIPCDIVILPSSDLAQKAIDLSHGLQKHGTLFELSNTGPFPHASLYMTQLKVGDLDKAKTILAAIAAAAPVCNLIVSRYDQAEGYIDADYARTDALDNLQMTVVAAINPIRDGMREKDKARLAEATGKVRENLKQYGYRSVGELFRPHITFTRFADGRAIDTSSLPNPNEFSGTFTKLGLFEMGDNGTCVRRIAEFDFGAPA